MNLAHGQAKRVARFGTVTLLACLAVSTASAQGAGLQVGAARGSALQDDIAKNVRLDQKLDAQVPPDLTFKDEDGHQVRLGDYFGKKPVLLNLIQYRCTMLCSEEMKILAKSLHELKFTAGDQFTLLTVSIDPREGPELAKEFKKGYLTQYNRPGAEKGWHFLTGDDRSLHQLADSIGYHYVYDPKTDQYAHPDGVQVLTPAGKVARYFFRLDYPPRDLRFAVVEAANSHIGSPMDAIALLCYHYNPVTGKYALAILDAVRLAAISTVLILLTGVAAMTLRDRQGKWRTARAASNSEG